MSNEISERIERLRANFNSTYDVMLAFMGWEPTDASRDCRSFQNALIDLLEDSDPSHWDTNLLEEEYGLIPLPRDRDGEVIHVGDIVWDEDGNEWKIDSFEIGNVIWDHAIKCANEGFVRAFNAHALTHRPPVTVESVLRELIDRVGDVENPVDEDYLIPKYAKRLRLATEVAE